MYHHNYYYCFRPHAYHDSCSVDGEEQQYLEPVPDHVDYRAASQQPLHLALIPQQGGLGPHLPPPPLPVKAHGVTVCLWHSDHSLGYAVCGV